MNTLNAYCRGRTLVKTSPLYQYDYGQILRLVGVVLPVSYEVHFSNTQHGNSITMIGDADGVEIPDICLASGSDVYAWLYLHTGANDGETEIAITIPVIQRAKPTNGTPTPVQQDAITQAIAALNAALTEAEAAIEHYPIITNGVWYVWDVDAGEYVSTGVLAQGPEGDPGDPGFSPVVTVTEISGGHEVTITDANGDHTFDVMDGTGGGTSDYTDLTNKPQIEGVTLSGDKSASDLGLAKSTDVPSASSSTPQPLGTAAAGSSTDYARADHVHAKPTAADVGAVPIETYNPVSKTDSMTQNVGLDENGRLWTNPGSSGSGIGSDQLVFDYTFSGNWHKINVTAINYSTGVITLEANSAPFTDDYNTAPRVACVPLFENVNAQLKYGFMPPELWSLPRGNGRGVLVGTNQIKLYSGAETSIDSITETANIDLTRFQIWVETSRNHAVNSVTVSDLDFSHKYKISMFFPYGSFHKTSCIAIRKGNNVSYGEGHGTGYAINTQANLQGSSANFQSVTLNLYETISLRNVYYGYTDLLYIACPILLEGELHKISDGTWILDSSIMYANWGSNAPAATKTPSFITNSGRVYLNNMPSTIKFESGNMNTILDGTKIQIWDIGTSVSSTIVTNVGGSTPSITGVADHRSVCGEVSTLSIQAPASGCIDVVFESGSTATVLTVTTAKSGATLKWANGFDPTSLDANTTYEINILDGEFGVVGSWT